MSERILKNVSVYGVITDIVMKDGKIVSVGKTDKQGEDKKGEKAYPGLIDIHTHGELMSRYTNDTDVLRECISTSFGQLISSSVTVKIASVISSFEYFGSFAEIAF